MTAATAPSHRAAAPLMAMLVLGSACAAGPGLTPREAVAGGTPAAEVAPTPDTAPASEEPTTENFYAAIFDDPTVIDNEWFPFSPGTHWVYEGTAIDGEDTIEHRIEFSVTDLTKEIAGVRTRVAWIVDYSDGELVEKEIAFYAQANDGTVWYLGEHPEEYEGGEFIDAPTWIHGVDQAVAGIKMPGVPATGGPSFSQGWAPSVEFTDRGAIAEIVDEFCITEDCFPGLLIVEEYNPEEPDAFQLKYYARGLGNVATRWRGADATQEQLDLIEFRQLDPSAVAEIRAEALALEAHAYEISPDVYGLTRPMVSTKP
jgi:hypothetical protein